MESRPDTRLSRGSLPGAVSHAMARIKREFYGKGPARTRTYIFDRFVVAVLDDVLTPVERALKEGGRSGLVRRVRLAFEDMMTATFTGEVERLTGLPVVAYHSQIVFDPDMAIELFVLDGSLDEPGRRSAHPAEVTSAEETETGQVGDADALPGPSERAPVLPAETSGDGPLRAAIANAVVRITLDHWGKGPVRTKAFLQDNFVFCVLEEPLTTVERTLVDGGEPHLVREMRMEFQDMVGERFAAEVEQLTGRRVLACHNQIVFDPDVLFEIFVLEPTDESAEAQPDDRPAARTS